MFRTNTVFIVGAGGSRELGLPMGEELKSVIAKKLSFEFRGYNLSGGDGKIYDAVVQLTQDRQARDRNPWFTAGRQIASAMPQATSIDNFLHTHADNEHIVEMGKLSIAASILEAERQSKIFSDIDRGEMIRFHDLDSSWHKTFCKMLFENVQIKDLAAIFDNVSIITFNYDRCIEVYICDALQNYFLISRADAEELMTRLAIIHPYGQVGQLPWQAGADGIPFGRDLPGVHLPKVAAQIRTFTERIEDDKLMDELRRVMQRANRLVFLGFSYGKMNLELLKSDRELGGPRVYGTSKGLSTPNTLAVSGGLSRQYRANPPAELANLTCDQMLQDYWIEMLS